MQTQTEIRALLESLGRSPRKALGQNFLIDGNLLGKLVELAGLTGREVVLEVGPGTGTLTEELVKHAGAVVAVELDVELAMLLRDRLAGTNLTVLHCDALAGKHQIEPKVFAALAAAVSSTPLPPRERSAGGREAESGRVRVCPADSPSEEEKKVRSAKCVVRSEEEGMAASSNRETQASASPTEPTIQEPPSPYPLPSRERGEEEAAGVPQPEDSLAPPTNTGRVGAEAAPTLRAENPAVAPVHLVANLPYNIAVPLVIDLLLASWRAATGQVLPGEAGVRVDRLTFTVQRELALRFAAGAGDELYGQASVIVGLLAQATMGRAVPAEAFWPRPKVRSQMLRLDFDAAAAGQLVDADMLGAVLSAVFSQRRKKIAAAGRLAGVPFRGEDFLRALATAGVDPGLRPEMVAPAQYRVIANELALAGRAPVG